MTQKKQTAVEWLMENLHTAKDPFAKAKKIEKQQIIDAVNNSCDAKQDYFEGNQEHDAMRGEQYYSETYGGKNEQQ